MAVNSLSAAKFICSQSSWTLSPLKVQKILYIIHMVLIGTEKISLVDENFEAWDLGPVLPNVYHRFKIFGANLVQDRYAIADIPDEVKKGKERDNLVKGLESSLGSASVGKLVNATHWEEGAWAKNYMKGGVGIVIPNEDIAEEYEKRFANRT